MHLRTGSALQVPVAWEGSGEEQVQLCYRRHCSLLSPPQGGREQREKSSRVRERALPEIAQAEATQMLRGQKRPMRVPSAKGQLPGGRRAGGKPREPGEGGWGRDSEKALAASKVLVPEIPTCCSSDRAETSKLLIGGGGPSGQCEKSHRAAFPPAATSYMLRSVSLVEVLGLRLTLAPIPKDTALGPLWGAGAGLLLPAFAPVLPD